MTFSTAKSLNLLWPSVTDPVAEAVRAAHDEGVIDTLAFLESEAARTRRGQGGAIHNSRPC